jgi:TetR/AcrR family transcriptional regulator, transcriptional repressor of aconitase
MPRLKEETRLARRREIADAALRRFAAHGFTATSMADIIAESGMSAGSIYSHFDGKAAIIREAASGTLDDRLREIVATLEASGSSPTPGSLFAAIVDGMFASGSRHVLLRIWAEMPTDPDLAAIGAENFARIRARVEEFVVPWASARAGEDLDTADERVGGVADLVIAAVHGFVVRAALEEPAALERLRRLLASALDEVPLSQ